MDVRWKRGTVFPVELWLDANYNGRDHAVAHALEHTYPIAI
jgi:hypothetical protein